MTESKLWKTVLYPYFMSKGFFAYRMEHARIPDVYLSYKNDVFWCEIKCIDKVSAKHGEFIFPKWRPGQLAWIEEQRVGGTENVFLALWYVNNTFFLPPKQYYEQEELWNNRMLEPENYLMSLWKKNL